MSQPDDELSIDWNATTAALSGAIVGAHPGVRVAQLGSAMPGVGVSVHRGAGQPVSRVHTPCLVTQELRPQPAGDGAGANRLVFVGRDGFEIEALVHRTGSGYQLKDRLIARSIGILVVDPYRCALHCVAPEALSPRWSKSIRRQVIEHKAMLVCTVAQLSATERAAMQLIHAPRFESRIVLSEGRARGLRRPSLFAAPGRGGARRVH